jgi:mannuronan 5-epimerase
VDRRDNHGSDYAAVGTGDDHRSGTADPESG